MSGAVKEAVSLMEILPETEQNFALEFIKRLVIAWDPDFTKVTLAERNALEEAKKTLPRMVRFLMMPSIGIKGTI